MQRVFENILGNLVPLYIPDMHGYDSYRKNICPPSLAETLDRPLALMTLAGITAVFY